MTGVSANTSTIAQRRAMRRRLALFSRASMLSVDNPNAASARPSEYGGRDAGIPRTFPGNISNDVGLTKGECVYSVVVIVVSAVVLPVELDEGFSCLLAETDGHELGRARRGMAEKRRVKSDD